jgi:hypothetical protein
MVFPFLMKSRAILTLSRFMFLSSPHMKNIVFSGHCLSLLLSSSSISFFSLCHLFCHRFLLHFVTLFHLFFTLFICFFYPFLFLLQLHLSSCSTSLFIPFPLLLSFSSIFSFVPFHYFFILFRFLKILFTSSFTLFNFFPSLSSAFYCILLYFYWSLPAFTLTLHSAVRVLRLQFFAHLFTFFLFLHFLLLFHPSLSSRPFFLF